MYRILLISLLSICAYFSVGAYVLYEKIPSYLFPHIALAEKTEEILKFELYDSLGNGLLVREYGHSKEQCIVFFPGQHGGVKHYEKELFTAFQRSNFKVFSVSYPGQDGAKGKVESIATLIALINTAMETILLKCSSNELVVYGRSMGATVAAFSIDKSRVSGLILESVAPSLPIAISDHLNSKWYLKPLSLLPISTLLLHEYKLSDSFLMLKNIPVVIFQGDRDIRTPLKQLQKAWNYRNNVSLHIVKTGQHSNTYIQALDEIINTATNMVM